LHVARRVVGDAHEAEDLVHDAVLRALDRLDRVDRTRPFAPWFFAVLTHLALNRRRDRARRATAPWPTVEPAATATGDAAERAEVRARFAAAVDALPPRQRLIVLQHDVDGVDSATIAATLGVTPETVRWHLHTARRALRAALSDLDPRAARAAHPPR
jgi:RNA polymerase sigma-70 factor (ECF subfamily)